MPESKTPKLANRFLRWFCGEELEEEFRGDLEEEYSGKINQKKILKARFWYWLEVIVFIWHFYSRNRKSATSDNSYLLFSHLQIAFRKIYGQKLYSFINISGLAIGLACCLVLMVFVLNELSFDRFHAQSDRIYRVLIGDENESMELEAPPATITAAVGPSMVEDFPEVLQTVRLASPFEGFFTYDDKRVNARNIFYADSTLFSVFSFKLLKGNRSKALTAPKSIVLTPQLSHNLFGNLDAIGKVVTLNGKDELLVTGIIEEAPVNSQIKYSALISFSSLYEKDLFLDWNGGWNYFTYILLDKNVDLPALNKKFPQFMYRHINQKLEKFGVQWVLMLEPLTDVHLFSKTQVDFETKGSLSNIIIFASSAVIILVLACINFINLTTIQATSRSREIGVRKVAGASKRVIISQFLVESTLITVLAFILAGILIMLVRPNLVGIFGDTFRLFFIGNWKSLSLIAGLLIFVILVSSFYPAIIISSFQPVKAIKGNVSARSGSYSLVNGLMIFQFAISIILITCTIIVFRQLEFISNKNLGYKKENILVVKLNSEAVRNNVKTLKIELERIPGVIMSAASSDVPGNGFTSNGYIPEGMETPVMFNVLDIDDDYLKTMDISIVLGNGFNPDINSDDNHYIINESLARQMGWDDPVGKLIKRNGNHEVIGVVKDFNYATLHQDIAPLLFTQKPWQGFRYLSLRIQGDQVATTMNEIEKTWKKFNTVEPLEYYFLDQSYDSFYQRERELGNMFFYYSVISIILGCMGLFGLIAFSVHQRLKEIGIRKVLGASTISLSYLLSKSYSLKVILANLIAWPIAYFAMQQWLNTFHYQIGITATVLIISGLSVLVIALVTVNIQTLKAIHQNPVRTLQVE